MKLFLIVFSLLLATSGGVFMFNKSRGIRNNNPGNIRHGQDWQGMQAVQTDDSFIQFKSPVYGIRALNKILKTYYMVYGLNTVRGIVSRYAPSSENNTASYVQAVANQLGVEPDQVINVQTRALELSQAIIKHENGSQPYPLTFVEQGVELGWA